MFFFNNQTYKSLLSLSVILLTLASLLGISVHFASAIPEATDILVDVNSGVDTPNCGTEGQPCASIQYAVNVASATSGQIIRVAAGIYTYNAVTDTCSNVIGTTAVVCIRNKELSILGGYTTNNWVTPDPSNNITIIDGQNSKRGIIVQHGSNQPPATLHMEGFTVQNGYIQGATSGADSNTFAFGGGMRADFSTVILKHMVFKNNIARGGNTAQPYGGAAAGAGIAIRAGSSKSQLEDIIFEGNQAWGGDGSQRGGYAIGGGLFTFESTLNGSHLIFDSNTTTAGNSNGSGSYNGEKADAQGAGIAFQLSSDITFNDITVTNNTATGGNAPNGSAGGAFGAGIFTEEASISIYNLAVQDNVAHGGTGENNATDASLAFGGGIAFSHSNSTVSQASIIHNMAQGGDGNIYAGSGSGGGIYIERFSGSATTALTNVIIADNSANMGNGNTLAGGGGGGLILNGADATLTHVTVAQNRLGTSGMQGNGIVLISGAQATISHSIIADHTDYSGAIAIHAQSGNTVTFNNNLLSGNITDIGGGGTFNGTDSNFSGSPNFVSAGFPNYDYHINNSSAAIGQAIGSTTAVDIDNQSRTNFGLPDVGADEFVAIILTASPMDGQLSLTWAVSPELLSGLDHYQIQVTPSAGASDPVQGTSINVGVQTALMLTGLTNYKNYTITVNAETGADATIAQSNVVTAFPTDLHIYLPVILK